MTGRLRIWLIERRGYEYLFAPAVTLAILCVAFAERSLWPFGTLSVVTSDMEIQYVGFFGWLTQVLHGDASPFYSFSQGMGEGTAALFAYYLSSPFNLLAWFFTPETCPQLMSVLTLAKLSVASLICYAFLRGRFGAGTVRVLLACSYALSGWCVCECSNIMWLDGAIMLPLIALGTWRLVEQSRCGLLFASVAVAVVANWYTAYMDCLFSVLYFFVCRLRRSRGETGGAGAQNSHGEGGRESFLRSGLRYAATMLLALGASAVVFLPAVLGLMGTKEGSSLVFDASLLHFAYYPWELGASLVVTSGPCGDWDVFAPIWTSSVAVVLAAAHLANRGMPARERLLAALPLLVMLFCLCAGPLDVVWSGFKAVTSFSFRYSFVVVFSLVELAAYGCVSLGEAGERVRVRALGVGAALVAALVALSWAAVLMRTEDTRSSLGALVLTCALYLLQAALLWRAFAGGSALARTCLVCASALTALELGFNASAAFANYHLDADAWGTYLEGVSDVYENVELGSDGVRVGNAAYSFQDSEPGCATTSEGFVLGASSMSEYTSTLGGAMVDMLASLGYSGINEVYGYYYNSPMLVTDSLLGVDYIIDDEQPVASEYVASGDAYGYEGYSLWRNSLAMPAAYGIHSGAGAVSWQADDFDCASTLAELGLDDFWRGFSVVRDPFANQEAMLADMTGEDASGLYVAASVTEDEAASWEEARTWRITVEASGPLYLYEPVLAACQINAIVVVDGEEVQRIGGSFNNNVICLGEYEAGDEVEIALVLLWPTDDGRAVLAAASDADLLCVQTLDTACFAELRGQLDADSVSVDAWGDGHVSMSVSASSDECVLAVVPYDSGWSATVDGQAVELRQCYGGLCGVDVSAGEHVVELRYETPGLRVGAVVSMVSVVVFCIWRRVRLRHAAGC